MKSKEELTKIKEAVETLNEKLRELTEEEFAQVTGGALHDMPRRRDDEKYVMKLDHE